MSLMKENIRRWDRMVVLVVVRPVPTKKNTSIFRNSLYKKKRHTCSFATSAGTAWWRMRFCITALWTRSRNFRLRFASGSFMSWSSAALAAIAIITRKANNKIRRTIVLLLIMIDVVDNGCVSDVGLWFCIRCASSLYKRNVEKNKIMNAFFRFHITSHWGVDIIDIH